MINCGGVSFVQMEGDIRSSDSEISDSSENATLRPVKQQNGGGGGDSTPTKTATDQAAGAGGDGPAVASEESALKKRH